MSTLETLHILLQTYILCKVTYINKVISSSPVLVTSIKYLFKTEVIPCVKCGLYSQTSPFILPQSGFQPVVDVPQVVLSAQDAPGLQQQSWQAGRPVLKKEATPRIKNVNYSICHGTIGEQRPAPLRLL